MLMICRDSLSYLDRLITQLNGAFGAHQPAHLVICESNSTDGTKQRLAQIAADGDSEVHGDVTMIEFDLDWPVINGSANHPSRWRRLETAWNECLKHLEPSKYAVCVESDLIWSVDVLDKMISHLDAGRGDVILPMLMRDIPAMGKYYYDIHANAAGGVNFNNYPPYNPLLKADEQFLTLDFGGGMLCTRGETLAKAHWAKDCILQWPDGTKVVMDTWSEILHP